jgi:RNA polymerase sigma factor (sigma-70 family)
MGLALREIHSAPSLTEQQLVAAVRAGDDHAFGQLFSRYRRKISTYVYGLVGDYGRAEDITQEVFISALRRMRETDRPIAFRPWIYEIARNACIDEHRRTQRAVVVSLDEQAREPGGQVPPMPDTGSPEQGWERKQQIGNLFGAFSGLSEAHHQILVMREFEGLSYGEIGARLGMSRPVVESTLFRARRRLTQEYGELSSGQRCQEVRAAVDEEAVRALASRGIRERRRIARHFEFCDSCLRYARAAGIDDTALRVPSAGRRVAALLPFGWLRLLRGRGRGSGSPGPGSGGAGAPWRSRPLALHRGSGGLGRGAAAAAVVAGMPVVLIPMALPAPGAPAIHPAPAAAVRTAQAAVPVSGTAIPSALGLARPASVLTPRTSDRPAAGSAVPARPRRRRAGSPAPAAGHATPVGGGAARPGAAGSSTPAPRGPVPAGTPVLTGAIGAAAGALATTTQIVTTTTGVLVPGTASAVAQTGQALTQTGQALTQTGQALAQTTGQTVTTTGQALTTTGQALTQTGQALSGTASGPVAAVPTTAGQLLALPGRISVPDSGSASQLLP